MKRKKNLPAYKNYQIVPFHNAEEAWFWFSRCQNLRNEGARFGEGTKQRTRPCDPDDVYREVQRLKRKGILHKRHLSVLGKFGKLETPPDPRHYEEEPEARLWDEALDRLTTPLKTKGIIDEDH
ncbi:MAG: hypothetical protein OQJ97_11115 [Rhodospirillales bacterium]|nr:hypothetical protein [Rhodospirillales bacterium]